MDDCLSLQVATRAQNQDAATHFILYAMVLDANGEKSWQYIDDAPPNFDVNCNGWVPLGYWYAFSHALRSGDGETPADLGYVL